MTPAERDADTVYVANDDGPPSFMTIDVAQKLIEQDDEITRLHAENESLLARLEKLETPAGEPTSDDARDGLRAGDEGRQSPDRDA